MLLAVAGMLPTALFALDVSKAKILRELSFVKCLVTPCGVLWSKRQKSREDALTVSRKHGFGMELHSVHREFAMAERHDFSVVAFCSDFETARQ